jgi:hypothetical protein
VVGSAQIGDDRRPRRAGYDMRHVRADDPIATELVGVAAVSDVEETSPDVIRVVAEEILDVVAIDALPHPPAEVAPDRLNPSQRTGAAPVEDGPAIAITEMLPKPPPSGGRKQLPHGRHDRRQRRHDARPLDLFPDISGSVSGSIWMSVHSTVAGARRATRTTVATSLGCISRSG